jgi:excisionase family DNA binding protein
MTSKIKDEPLYTSEEVMRYLKISRTTLNRWLSTGYLKGVKVGHRWRFGESYLKGND